MRQNDCSVLLDAHFVRNGQLGAALCTTARKNFATILRAHTLAETVLVCSLAT